MDATSAPLPRTVGGVYEIDEAIGEGGMGRVYRAHHRLTGQHVAIKVLAPALAGAEDMRERFADEANALASVDHPNVVRMHTLLEEEGRLCLVMDLVPGDDLDEYIESAGPLPLEEALSLTRQLLSALDHVHGRGVVHRDIKPSNIRRRPDGTIQLMDLGVARREGTARRTATGVAVGTPGYMAPEQILGEAVDGRADLYAAGLVFFELLAGRPVFDGDNDYLVRRSQVEDEPPNLDGVRPGLPAGLSDLIRRVLAKRPADRPSSAAVFAADLDSVTAAHSSPPHPLVAGPPEPSPGASVAARSRRAGRSLLWVLSLAVLAVAAVALIRPSSLGPGTIRARIAKSSPVAPPPEPPNAPASATPARAQPTAPKHQASATASPLPRTTPQKPKPKPKSKPTPKSKPKPKPRLKPTVPPKLKPAPTPARPRPASPAARPSTRPAPTTGPRVLNIVSRPSGATVHWLGRQRVLGRTPLHWTIPVGVRPSSSLLLGAERHGYHRQEARVTPPQPGSDTTVRFTLAQDCLTPSCRGIDSAGQKMMQALGKRACTWSTDCPSGSRCNMQIRSCERGPR